MPRDVVFFDLDGTLVDSRAGIFRCLQIVATQMFNRELAPQELMRFVGPPIRLGIRDILGVTDSQKIEEAVSIYRQHYDSGGVFEYSLYDGVSSCLESLKRAGFTLFVVTSKMDLSAIRIVEHAGLLPLFQKVYGPNRQGEPKTKAELIARVLEEQMLDRARVTMIGDRKYDALAAKSHNIPTIGVTYGFGSVAELQEAGVSVLCGSAEEIQPALVADR